MKEGPTLTQTTVPFRMDFYPKDNADPKDNTKQTQELFNKYQDILNTVFLQIINLNKTDKKQFSDLFEQAKNGLQSFKDKYGDKYVQEYLKKMTLTRLTIQNFYKLISNKQVHDPEYLKQLQHPASHLFHLLLVAIASNKEEDKKNFFKEIKIFQRKKKQEISNKENIDFINKDLSQIDIKNFFQQQLSKRFLDSLEIPHKLKEIQGHLKTIQYHPPLNSPPPKLVSKFLEDMQSIIRKFLDMEKQNQIKVLSLMSEQGKLELNWILKNIEARNNLLQDQLKKEGAALEKQQEGSFWSSIVDVFINVAQIVVGAVEMAVGDEAGALDVAAGAVGLIKDTCEILKETGVCSGEALDKVIEGLNYAQMALQAIAAIVDLAGSAFKAVEKIGGKVEEKAASKEFSEGVKDILKEEGKDMEEQLKSKVNDLFKSIEKDLRNEEKPNSFEMKEFKEDTVKEPEKFDGSDEDVIDEADKKTSKVNDKALKLIAENREELVQNIVKELINAAKKMEELSVEKIIFNQTISCLIKRLQKVLSKILNTVRTGSYKITGGVYQIQASKYKKLANDDQASMNLISKNMVISSQQRERMEAAIKAACEDLTSVLTLERAQVKQNVEILQKTVQIP